MDLETKGVVSLVAGMTEAKMEMPTGKTGTESTIDYTIRGNDQFGPFGAPQYYYANGLLTDNADTTFEEGELDGVHANLVRKLGENSTEKSGWRLVDIASGEWKGETVTRTVNGNRTTSAESYVNEEGELEGDAPRDASGTFTDTVVVVSWDYEINSLFDWTKWDWKETSTRTDSPTEGGGTSRSLVHTWNDTRISLAPITLLGMPSWRYETYSDQGAHTQTTTSTPTESGTQVRLEITRQQEITDSKKEKAFIEIEADYREPAYQETYRLTTTTVILNHSSYHSSHDADENGLASNGRFDSTDHHTVRTTQKEESQSISDASPGDIHEGEYERWEEHVVTRNSQEEGTYYDTPQGERRQQGQYSTKTEEKAREQIDWYYHIYLPGQPDHNDAWKRSNDTHVKAAEEKGSYNNRQQTVERSNSEHVRGEVKQGGMNRNINNDEWYEWKDEATTIIDRPAHGPASGETRGRFIADSEISLLQISVALPPEHPYAYFTANIAIDDTYLLDPLNPPPVPKVPTMEELIETGVLQPASNDSWWWAGTKAFGGVYWDAVKLWDNSDVEDTYRLMREQDHGVIASAYGAFGGSLGENIGVGTVTSAYEGKNAANERLSTSGRALYATGGLLELFVNVGGAKGSGKVLSGGWKGIQGLLTGGWQRTAGRTADEAAETLVHNNMDEVVEVLDDLKQSADNTLDDAAQGFAKPVVDKSWKSKIEGTAQKTGTEGHAFRSYREAIKEAKKAEVERVHLNHGYNRALGLDPKTISPNRRPDVTSIYKDGAVKRIEVRSLSDDQQRLINRNLGRVDKSW